MVGVVRARVGHVVQDVVAVQPETLGHGQKSLWSLGEEEKNLKRSGREGESPSSAAVGSDLKVPSVSM